METVYNKVYYELQVERDGKWHFNQRQPTLSAACRHKEIVEANTPPGSIFTGVRIVEVRTTRTVVE